MSADPRKIRARIEEIYRSGKVLGEDGSEYSLGEVSVTPERGRFLVDLCRAENAKATLEIGMAWGLSTLFLLEALATKGEPGGRHTVIDPFQSSRWHGGGIRSVREAGAWDMIEFHEQPSEILLPRMIEQQRVFDLAFVDGNHRFDAVFVDLIFVNRLLKPGGVVILDDAWFDPVYLACRFGETNLGYALIADFFDGDHNAERSPRMKSRPLMRAYRKPAIDAQRDIFHFVPFFDGVDDMRIYEERRLRDEGIQALARGASMSARQSFAEALRLNPRRFNTWMRFLRTFLPARLARSVSGRRFRGEGRAARDLR
jgi:predicted O-methyltransferase YrrM